MVIPDYSDIVGPNGTEDNIGGATERWWFAPKDWFASIADVKKLDDGTATAFTDYSVIATDHTFTSGKGFIEIYCTPDKGSGSWAAQGETDGHSYKGTMKAFVPGINGTLLGMLRKLKNEKCIVLQELADGKVLQYGSPRFSAKVLATNIGTATNSSGVRGSEIEVTCMESGPVLYTGEITTP